MDLAAQVQSKWSVLLLLLLLVRASRASLAITFCSSENVASDYPANYAEFQSTGLCGDQCQGSFAFAILQGYNCWCSNYAPAYQLDTLTCNEPCPGISSEWCGSQDAGLYGYFQLPGGKPLGTSGTGASQASSASFSSVSTTRKASSSDPPSPVPSSSSSRYFWRPSSSPWVTVVPPQSSVQTESSTSSPSTVYSAPSSTEPSSSFTSTSSPSSSPSPTTSTPTEVYTSVTTVTGQVRTVLVTPTASADATLGQSSMSGSSGVSAGKVAGIVVAVVLGLGLAIGAGIWFWLRRRRNKSDTSPEGSFTAERMGGSSNTSNNIPSRQVSQLSSAELLGKAPRIQTNFFPSDNDPRSAGTTSSNNIDRRSLTTDQRLNPWALYSQDDRRSSLSLQDNQDYSRQLRVANPD